MMAEFVGKPTNHPTPTNPFSKDAAHETVAAALEDCEQAIIKVFIFPPNTLLTYTSLFGMGVGRRAVALSSGFRAMVKQCNSLCAIPMVRMQLDTAIRFYAGFFVADHQQFCRDVLKGKQINKMKSREGHNLSDHYLVKRVAEKNPWMTNVYETCSGYIHFSHHHIKEALRIDESGKGMMAIGSNDFDREPKHFLESMQCMLHLNEIIHFALSDWFGRMCSPDGVKVSASELWGQNDQQEQDQPC
ncbi:MAG: hypothetical protein FWD67_12270 [Betaproteobacteria bacterium]|nr:hypothetical protein [Betaproteobacteria bacterium]